MAENDTDLQVLSETACVTGHGAADSRVDVSSDGKFVRWRELLATSDVEFVDAGSEGLPLTPLKRKLRKPPLVRIVRISSCGDCHCSEKTFVEPLLAFR